jgi:radical SAM superfamily enzyme YgiQ (UPF0313 family)
MASRILLTSTNRCVIPDPVFPLGLSYLNAALRQSRYETRWFDCLAEKPSLESVLCDFRPDFVGVSLRNIDDVLIRKRETYFQPLAGICTTIRRMHRCPVILGGSGFSLFPEQLLELSAADFGIQGEGEESLPALISALTHGTDFTGIPGLVYRRDGKIVANPPTSGVAPVALESTDWPPHLVAYYLRTGGMLNLQTQRGCAHGCNYCTYPLIEGHVMRRRPPEMVADEMAHLQATGAKYVFITDSVFNSSPRHVVETCEALLRRNLALRWGCFLRPQGLTPELVKLMAWAGLAHVEFGSDSFCDSVLAAYTKHLTFDDILQSSELVHKENIDYCHYLICGGPGETLDTLRTSFENSKRLPGAVIMAVVGIRVYPGTALHRRALRERLIQADTDLLAPTYYLASDLSSEAVFGQLNEFARQSPNWIVGDPTPDYAKLVERLRERGIVGPLWSYFAMLQRVRPHAVAAASDEASIAHFSRR